MGAYVGGTLGWRTAFALVAVMSFVAALWIWRRMPDGVKPPALSVAAWGETLRSQALMLTIAVTVACSAGQFVVLAYFAPYFKEKIAATPGELGLLFMWFGVFGFVGNILVSRHIDRFGPARAAMVCIALMAFTMLAWPLGATIVIAAAVMVPWALGCFAMNSAQQARLVGLAPPLAPASIALNSSAIYAGQALGAAGGGWLIARDGMDSLHWAGLAALVVSAAVSAWATSYSHRGR